MVEDSYRRRTNLHKTGRHEADKPKKKSFGLIGFQTLICLIAIAAAVVIRLIGGGTYKTVQASVSQAIDTAFTGSQVSQVFAAIKSNFPDMKTVFSTSGSSSASGSSSKNSSSSSKSSSSSSSSSSPSSKSSSSSSAKNAAIGFFVR